MSDESLPAVVLGAGYAGLTLCQTVRRRGRGKVPLVLVDRHPVHVLRTELYEIGRLAEAGDDASPWALPLARLLEGKGIDYRQGEVEAIDLKTRAVTVSGESISYGSLGICLGSVAAFYGVPGASEHTDQVYRLTAAQRLARKLRDVEKESSTWRPDRRPRVVVVGGGSTGTEVAAEIATRDWAAVVGPGARPPQVILVVGAVPLLAGLPDGLIRHARDLLVRSGVVLFEAANVTKVEPERVTLEDGMVLPFDICVWCAGLQAPQVVRSLPVPHGHAGRLRVSSTLEVEGFPGVFAVGDAAEIEEPQSRVLVPATAQAALAEARVAGANLVARIEGRPLTPFVYRERSSIVQVGVGRAAGSLRRWTLWGRPASVLKSIVQKEYAYVTARGGQPPGL